MVVHSLGTSQYSFPSANVTWWDAFSNKEARLQFDLTNKSCRFPSQILSERATQKSRHASSATEKAAPTQLFGDFCTVASDGVGGTDDATSDGGGGGTDGGGQEGDKAQVAASARLADGWPFKKGAGNNNS